jgi:hypothetical protein
MPGSTIGKNSKSKIMSMDLKITNALKNVKKQQKRIDNLYKMVMLNQGNRK